MYKKYRKQFIPKKVKQTNSFANGFKKIGGQLVKTASDVIVSALDADRCQTKGCVRSVNKAGHKQCLPCFKKANPLPKATKSSKGDNFRTKFPAKYRTQDGHQVRSKAEVLIDNWLFTNEIMHSYERKLPIEADVYCDFYLPKSKVYIEYWGIENNPKYKARKIEKQKIYKQLKINLIELTEDDVMNLDDTLPRLLLKYKVKVN